MQLVWICILPRKPFISQIYLSEIWGAIWLHTFKTNAANVIIILSCTQFEVTFHNADKEEIKSHWVHLFVFSPVRVIKCLLKSSAWEKAYSHWLHLFDFSPQMFSNISSKHLYKRVQSPISYICFTFLQLVFLNGPSNSQPKRMYSGIGCTCLVFLYHAFSNASSNACLTGRKRHICCICLTFLHCGIPPVYGWMLILCWTLQWFLESLPYMLSWASSKAHDEINSCAVCIDSDFTSASDMVG